MKPLKILVIDDKEFLFTETNRIIKNLFPLSLPR